MRQFIEVMSRLYNDGKVDEEKINELYKNGKITKQEKDYILNTN